ncbi:MAG: hypothetical protein WCB04_14790 [Mycobacteriales bacterium]
MRTSLTVSGVALAGTMLGALAYTAVMNLGVSPAAATGAAPGSAKAASCAAPARVVGQVCETVVHRPAPAGPASHTNAGPGAVSAPTQGKAPSKAQSGPRSGPQAAPQASPSDDATEADDTETDDTEADDPGEQPDAVHPSESAAARGED